MRKKMNTAPVWFSLFTLCLLFSSVLCRSLQKTTVFEVSASTRLAKHALTLNPHSLKTPLQAPYTTASTYSVSIHSRTSLRKHTHKTYDSLTLARLARDSARVNYITSKLDFKLSNLTRSDLKPIQTEIRPENLQSPVTSGISQGSGEYFARLGVGTPVKQYYMVLDTGSDINWIQCQPCEDCYQQSDPIFNPTDSNSYSKLSCSSTQCSALQVSSCSRAGDSCLYQVSYGDGSYTGGSFATETVSFGSSGSVPQVAIGCGHDNEGLFVGAAGLLGLGAGELSLPSQVKATSFSYCLPDRDSASSSTIDFNSAMPVDSVMSPLLRNPKIDTFFYIGVTGLSVGGELLSLPPSIFEINESGRGGVIADSGTAVTRLPSKAYTSLRDSFKQGTQHLPASTGFALFDTCYDLSSMTRISVPTVAFHFAGGKTLSLPAKNYLIPVEAGGKYCLAFAPTAGSLTIIGNVQQQGTRVSYDIANSKVGFSAGKC
ncbi:protein ASPARTIC PROTEASE IN GUARD CELL 1-like [Apium graveolens]|uniref:protein ASPARTIC PROTEASE IN GUARD CELL 1-like n=1 Tax=Apium graveolens TaxID=4045 RepID=UPI003D78B45F